jgi:hypothetical protein
MHKAITECAEERKMDQHDMVLAVAVNLGRSTVQIG